jgi:hypothetical protein
MFIDVEKGTMHMARRTHTAARRTLRSTRSNGNPRKTQTSGKRTAKPDRAVRGRNDSKGAAQFASKTRKAREAPWAISRGETDFRRTAYKTIKGHRGATDRKMQAKRDAQQARSAEA